MMITRRYGKITRAFLNGPRYAGDPSLIFSIPPPPAAGRRYGQSEEREG